MMLSFSQIGGGNIRHIRHNCANRLITLITTCVRWEKLIRHKQAAHPTREAIRHKDLCRIPLRVGWRAPSCRMPKSNPTHELASELHALTAVCRMCRINHPPMREKSENNAR
jgi:hypothetical protein